MSDLVVYSGEEIQLIKETVAAGCTETEFALLMQLSKTWQLDPFQKQIWAVKYPNSPAAIFCGRDGFLAIAHRSGQFDGMESGTETDENGKTIGWCRVWRKDMSRPFHVRVPLAEYEQRDKQGNVTKFWRTKPQTMITKVAEAQCLRKAFSVSGLYSPEEFDDAPQQQQVQRPMKDITPQAGVLVCDTCGIALRDDDALKTIREHSKRDMCRTCFQAWYTQQRDQAGEQA